MFIIIYLHEKQRFRFHKFYILAINSENPNIDKILNPDAKKLNILTKLRFEDVYHYLSA